MAPTNEQTGQLLALHDLLMDPKQILASMWNYGTFVSEKDGVSVFELRRLLVAKGRPVECKTVACAGGWACCFVQGLSIDADGNIQFRGRVGSDGTCPLSSAFGITRAEAGEIFYEANRPGFGRMRDTRPQDVARAIRKVLIKYEKAA